MVHFWQAGEGNTKKIDLWMSKLGMNTELRGFWGHPKAQPPSEQVGSKAGVSPRQTLQRSQLKPPGPLRTRFSKSTSRVLRAAAPPKPDRLGSSSLDLV